uniref:Reversion-inducing cysteine-rich protein with Kazal frizzled-like domain-containing protein n=1 Tax=Plectus sambesii TaxID=2011161 RepID=A0A914UX46_9BILA
MQFFSVDHPCLLGCPLSDMNFCRPVVDPLTTLYSRCNRQSDEEAKKVFNKWMNNTSITINAVHIPVRDLTECLGESFWRKVICDHALGRCTKESHSALMCKSDCIKLIDNCFINTRGFLSTTDIESICGAIPFVADEKLPCISGLDNWPGRSDRSHCDSILTVEAFPCVFQCNANEVCRIYREYDIVRHVCEKACTAPWTGSHRHLPSSASIAVGETILTQLNVPSFILVQPRLQECTCRWIETSDTALITDCLPFDNAAASADHATKCPKHYQTQQRLKSISGESVLLAAWFGWKPAEDWNLADALARAFKRFTNVAVCDIVAQVDGINVMIKLMCFNFMF